MTQIEREMAQYPETGIINPYINTKFVLTDEMIAFFNQYLLTYYDYPDTKIAEEFACKFDIIQETAKIIEHDYVVVNRARIYKRIENLFKKNDTIEEIVALIMEDFNLDKVNAEKYVYRAGMDGLDNKGGCFIKS